MSITETLQEIIHDYYDDDLHWGNACTRITIGRQRRRPLEISVLGNPEELDVQALANKVQIGLGSDYDVEMRGSHIYVYGT